VVKRWPSISRVCWVSWPSLLYLVFEGGERGPDENLTLQFEAISRMPPEEKQIIKALLEGMIIKHQTKQLVGNLSS